MAIQVAYGQDVGEDPIAVVGSSLRKPMLLAPIGKADPVCTVNLKQGSASISSSYKSQMHMTGTFSRTSQPRNTTHQPAGHRHHSFWMYLEIREEICIQKALCEQLS